MIPEEQKQQMAEAVARIRKPWRKLPAVQDGTLRK